MAASCGTRPHLQYGGQLRRQVVEPPPLPVDLLTDAALVAVQLLAVGGQPAPLFQLPVQPRQVPPVPVLARLSLAGDGGVRARSGVKLRDGVRAAVL